MLSIFDGYVLGIPPEVVGNIVNLRFITWFDNISKHKNSCVTAEELCEKFYKQKLESKC